MESILTTTVRVGSGCCCSLVAVAVVVVVVTVAREKKKKKKKHVEPSAKKTHGRARLQAMVARWMLGDQEPSGGVFAQALRQEERQQK